MTITLGENGSANQLRADLASTGTSKGAEMVGYLAPYTGAVGRTQASKNADTVSVLDFYANGVSGAAVDPTGVLDSTGGLQAAINTGKKVIAPSGSTYLINGGLSATTSGQVLDFTGCTVKLKDSATSKFSLTLAGTYQTVIGGTWDGNKATNVPGSLYDSASVYVTGNNCTVDGITSVNTAGIGVKGSSAVNDLTVQNCKISGTTLYGIFVDAVVGVSQYRNRAIGNTIDGALLTQNGILLTGDGSYAGGFGQYDWDVSGNVVTCGTATTSFPICIAVRGHRGNFANNRTVGGSMGISEGGNDTVYVGNNISNTSGAASYGIEISGKRCVVSGNRIGGVKFGISGTSNSPDDLVVTGNSIVASVVGVDPLAAANVSVTGNTIRCGVGVRATSASAGLSVSGNRLIGPGSGTGGTYPLLLTDPSAASKATFSNNICSGFSKLMCVYGTSALVCTDLSAVGNNFSNDMGADESGWFFLGSASAGARVCCIQTVTSGGGLGKDIHDQAANTFTQYSNAYATPESNVTAGIGSVYYDLNSAAGAFYKKSGANTNTGWVLMS